jgi:hypothetical protein
MQHEKYIEGKEYHALPIDFEIPDFLQMEIDQYLDDLNNHRGMSNDLFSEEIKYYIKWCVNLSSEQRDMLYHYYHKGGIFD